MITYLLFRILSCRVSAQTYLNVSALIETCMLLVYCFIVVKLVSKSELKALEKECVSSIILVVIVMIQFYTSAFLFIELYQLK